MSRLMVSESAPTDGTGYMTPREDHFMTGASPVESAPPHEKRVFEARQQHPNADSLARMIADARRASYLGKVSIRDRICCYQWTWFTMTMVSLGSPGLKETRSDNVDYRPREELPMSYILVSRLPPGHSSMRYMLIGYCQVPFRSDWLYYIGLVFFLFNICLFLMNCILISMRFSMVPGSFIHSFHDQTESLFIPAVVSYGISYQGQQPLLTVRRSCRKSGHVNQNSDMS